ncbi:MAG: ABC transporter ATP-binding protein [Lachnospiraceae bacterium]
MDLLRKFNYILSRRQKIYVILLFFIILFGTLMELAGVSIILPFVQAIVSPNTIMNNRYIVKICEFFQIDGVNHLLILISIVMILIYVVKNIYMCLMYNTMYHFIYNNQRKLANQMFRCYMEQPYIFHLSKNSSEMIRNITSDSAMFFSAILAYLQLLTEISVCLVLVTFLLLVDKSITIGIAGVLLVFIVFYSQIIKKKIQSMGESTRESQVGMTKWIQQGFGGIKEVKILGREQFFLNNYDVTYKEYADANRKFMIYSFLPKPLMETFCVASIMAVIALKLYRNVDLTYFAPTLSVFAIAAFRMLPSAGKIAQFINNIVYNRPAVDAVYCSLKDIEKLIPNTEKANCGKEEFDFHDAINIRHMDFHYPNVEKNVLNDVNLKIQKNLSVAFVGPSGAGKTTLADIILGVLQPQGGVASADDINIHENLRGWNKHLGYIPQSIFLTDDTIRNNIAFGIERDRIDEEQVWKALEGAQLKTFIESLDKGLDTAVGERGVRLSGGQRQRIGIARALYRDPDVLVLDEATSALDTETETAVMEAIENLSGKKTIIIIAHRLTTIRNCDMVYEINNGVVNLQPKKGE